MAEAAVNLAFLGVTSYVVGRDIYGYLPSLPKTSSKRFRGGEPTVTHEMDDTCDPAAQPPRIRHGPSLPGPTRAAVKACCESLFEQKYVEDYQASGAVPSTTVAGRVLCLNDLGQGTTATTRVGNKILMKYLQIEGMAYLPANTESDVYRLVVVLDHECFGASCTWTQYIQGASSNRVYSLPSMETVGKGKRFTTLVDKLIPLNATAVNTATPIKFCPFSLTVPLNCSTTYSGNSGTIADVVRNSLCVIEASSGGRVVAEWNSRLVFLDG